LVGLSVRSSSFLASFQQIKRVFCFFEDGKNFMDQQEQPSIPDPKLQEDEFRDELPESLQVALSQNLFYQYGKQ
jgi:hypothetical protein